jgi:hypothetical protein
LYICIKQTKQNKMRYYHLVKDSEGLIIEQHLCNTDKKRFSLECLEQITKGKYEIVPQSN